MAPITRLHNEAGVLHTFQNVGDATDFEVLHKIRLEQRQKNEQDWIQVQKYESRRQSQHLSHKNSQCCLLRTAGNV